MKHETIKINQALNILRKGGIVVVPTDTVYGLVVDASNDKAVKKLIGFKSRVPGKAISVFVNDIEMANKYVKISKKKLNILKNILPGPFTVVLPSRHKLVIDLEGEKGTLGIRLVDFAFITELVKRFGRPITATSANISGRPVCYSVDALLKSLPKSKKEMIDFVVDFGRLARNKPSTVVDLTESKIKILRHGDLMPSRGKAIISKNERETKQIAKNFIKKIIKKNLNNPVVIILEGELGVGKTIFVKGIGEFLGITNIISPTFTISMEYDVSDKFIRKLYHLDLYRIEEVIEFKFLGIDEMLKAGNLICIEWGEKIGEIFNYIKKKAQIIYVRMEYLSEKKRNIKIISNYQLSMINE